MSVNRLLVITSPHAERDTDYHAYYTGVHLPEIRALEGVVRAVRYRTESPKGAEGDPPQFAVSIDTTKDPAELLGELRTRMGSGEMTASDAIDTSRTVAYFLYE